MYSRVQVASGIKSFRYAVRTGACQTAEFHLRTLAGQGLPEGTWLRLQKVLNRCTVAPHFRRRGR